MRTSLNPRTVLLFRVVVEKEDALMTLNLVQSSNALHEIEWRFSGKCTEVKDIHPPKASSPMVVILDGSVIDASDEHPLKTPS